MIELINLTKTKVKCNHLQVVAETIIRPNDLRLIPLYNCLFCDEITTTKPPKSKIIGTDGCTMRRFE